MGWLNLYDLKMNSDRFVNDIEIFKISLGVPPVLGYLHTITSQ